MLGETLFKAMDNSLGEGFVISVIANLNRWDAEIMFPDESVSRLCFSMSNNYDDSRMIGQKTDKVHLAYAMSQDCDVFLTRNVDAGSVLGSLSPAMNPLFVRQELLVVHSPDIPLDSPDSLKDIAEIEVILPGHTERSGGYAVREPALWCRDRRGRLSSRRGLRGRT